MLAHWDVELILLLHVDRDHISVLAWVYSFVVLHQKSLGFHPSAFEDSVRTCMLFIVIPSSQVVLNVYRVLRSSSLDGRGHHRVGGLQVSVRRG
jgi:hypothetical protein